MYHLSLHDALPICSRSGRRSSTASWRYRTRRVWVWSYGATRSRSTASGSSSLGFLAPLRGILGEHLGQDLVVPAELAPEHGGGQRDLHPVEQASIAGLHARGDDAPRGPVLDELERGADARELDRPAHDQ